MVWICGTGNDTLYRFNPKTEYLVEFPLPFRVSYTREIEFDKEGNVWTSTSGPARHMENACGTVIKLEILDDLNEETGGMKLSPIKLSLAEQGIASEADRARVAKVKKAGENATKLIQSGKFDSAPFDAVDFALKVKNLEGRRSALSAAFGRLGGGVGGVKIEVVEKRINSIGSSQNKDYAINGFAHGLVAKDPERALKWANSIKDEGFRKIVVRNVSRRIKSQPANSKKPSQKSMEEKTGIHRLDSPKRAPFDAFVYVNRIPDKAREGESPKDFAGRIHGRLANQEGRIQLKLPPGMDLTAYQGFKSFLGSEGNPAISNCMACHNGPEFSAGKGSLRNHKKTGAELQAVIRRKMAKAAGGDQAYAGLEISDAEVTGLVSFLQSLNDVSDKRFRDLVLEAKVTDVTKKPTPKKTEGPKLKRLLRGTIRFEGPRPKRAPVHMDESSRKLHQSQPRDESVLIGKFGGLANVFVYIKNPPAGEYKLPTNPAILDQKGSIFIPRVQAVRVGQQLMMKNGDPFIHNVRSLSRKNRQFNIAQPQGSPDREKTFDQAEGPITLKCDFHRWMEAHLWVMDHPFYAVTNSEGEFEILDLPPGDYEVSAWHEKLGEQSQKITVRKDGSVSNFKFRARLE